MTGGGCRPGKRRRALTALDLSRISSAVGSAHSPLKATRYSVMVPPLAGWPLQLPSILSTNGGDPIRHRGQPCTSVTLQLYGGLVRLHLVPTFGSLALQDITDARVRRWRKSLLDTWVGEVTVAKAYRLLKAIMSTAVEDGMIRRNPCRIKAAGQSIRRSFRSSPSARSSIWPPPYHRDTGRSSCWRSSPACAGVS